MNHGFTFFILIAATFGALITSRANASIAFPPNEKQTVGNPIQVVTAIDESGLPINWDAFRNCVTIVSPIFTRCPHSCPPITSSLKQSVDKLGPGVCLLSLSFDPKDTSVDLAAFRKRFQLPENWRTARASGKESAPFWESIDFKFFPSEGTYLHSNWIVILDRELKISSYLYGTTYEFEDLRKAVIKAQRRKGSIETILLVLTLTGLGLILGLIKRRPSP